MNTFRLIWNVKLRVNIMLHENERQQKLLNITRDYSVAFWQVSPRNSKQHVLPPRKRFSAISVSERSIRRIWQPRCLSRERDPGASWQPLQTFLSASSLSQHPLEDRPFHIKWILCWWVALFQPRELLCFDNVVEKELWIKL